MIGVAEHATEEELTSREITVLRLITTGSSKKAIAGQLAIAEDMVKSHVTNILVKLGANDWTLRRGIIEL